MSIGLEYPLLAFVVSVHLDCSTLSVEANITGCQFIHMSFVNEILNSKGNIIFQM